MEKRVLYLALLMLSGHFAQGGECNKSKADACVEGVPEFTRETSHQELCSTGITAVRCFNAACDGPPYSGPYHLYIDGMKEGMESAGIECDFTKAGASSLQVWTVVIGLVSAVGLLVRGP